MAKSAPAPLSAALLGVPKGAAIPATDPGSTSVAAPEPVRVAPPASTPVAAEVESSNSEPRAGEGASAAIATPVAQQPARAPTKRRAPEPVPPPMDEVKTALTVRLPITTQERLREAAHRTRKEKQQIVDEALVAWMELHGY
jgi:hypothetical protein